MKSNNYVKAYEDAARELEALLEQQDKTEERILSLRKTMNVLSTLIQQSGEFSDNELDKLLGNMETLVQTSLTEEILKVVTHFPGPMTTSDVRDELNKLGTILKEHSNPLATINSVLNRLAEQGKVRETVKDGRKAWERVGVKIRLRSPHIRN